MGIIKDFEVSRKKLASDAVGYPVMLKCTCRRW